MSLHEETLSQILGELAEIRSILAGNRKEYLTVDEVASLTGRSAYTVRRWISERRITAQRVRGTGPRGKMLIARGELAKLISLGKGEAVPSAAVVDS